jgi:hypothetical protein
VCASDDLEDALASKEERRLSRALTLQYKVMFILEPSEQAKAAIGKRVTVADSTADADPSDSLAAWQSGHCDQL